MTTDDAYMVSSAAAADVARSATSGAPSWQPCAAVPTVKATQAIRVRMHGNGFLTARRPKERSTP